MNAQKGVLVLVTTVVYSSDMTQLLSAGESLRRVSFKGLVDLMSQYTDPAVFVPRGETKEEYFTEEERADGTYELSSITYAGGNPKRRAKYWRKAAVTAGIVVH